MYDNIKAISVEFDNFSPNFQENDDYNRTFLRSQEQYLENRRTSFGHVFVNEVMDALGTPRLPMGCVLGWTTAPITFDVETQDDFFIITLAPQGDIHNDI